MDPKAAIAATMLDQGDQQQQTQPPGSNLSAGIAKCMVSKQRTCATGTTLISIGIAIITTIVFIAGVIHELHLFIV